MANLKISKGETKIFKEKFEHIIFEHNNTQIKLVGLIKKNQKKLKSIPKIFTNPHNFSAKYQENIF